MITNCIHCGEMCLKGTAHYCPDSSLRTLNREVNHPPYYGGDVPHEVWKCLEAWELHLSAYKHSAVVYVARAGKKLDPRDTNVNQSAVRDIEKAIWWLNKERTLLLRALAAKDQPDETDPAATVGQHIVLNKFDDIIMGREDCNEKAVTQKRRVRQTGSYSADAKSGTTTAVQHVKPVGSSKRPRRQR